MEHTIGEYNQGIQDKCEVTPIGVAKVQSTVEEDPIVMDSELGNVVDIDAENSPLKLDIEKIEVQDEFDDSIENVGARCATISSDEFEDDSIPRIEIAASSDKKSRKYKQAMGKTSRRPSSMPVIRLLKSRMNFVKGSSPAIA